MAIYYVDATSGNDGNTGLSMGQAWKTIAKVNGVAFSAGDSVLFKRGETWRETLTIPSSGAAGNPIIFGDYGSGAKPIINAADIFTTWAVYAGTTWQKAALTEPLVVIMDGVWLTEGADRDSLNDHEWVWAGNVLYVRDDSGDPDLTGVVIEASQRAQCIVSTDKDYIRIRGLSIHYANSFGIWNERGDYWVISKCAFLDSDTNEILVRGTTAADVSVVGLIIRKNSFVSHSLNTNTLIQIKGTIDAKVYNNKCTLSASGSVIGTYSGGANGAGATSRGTLIYQNNISGASGGILVQYTNSARVYLNHVRSGAGYGISINRYSDEALIYNNLIHDLTATATVWNGIDINRGCDNGYVYYNTVYSVAGFSLTLEATVDACTGWTIKNNIFDSSANVDVGGVNASYYIEAGCTFDIDDNLVYTSDAIRRGGGVIVTNLGVWNATAGVGTDIEGDPLFVSPPSDFHIKVGSPCIGAGTIGIDITDDYDGAGRRIPPDIGAYEYVMPPGGISQAVNKPRLVVRRERIWTLENA